MPTSCGGAGIFSEYISTNTTTARAQGVSAADAAETAAQAWGLGTQDVLYIDLESYMQNPPTACLAIEKAFIGGWSDEINNNSLYWGGMYGSTCESNLQSMTATTPAHPKYVWASDNQTSPDVFGLTCLSDSYWTNHQRIHQFIASPGALPTLSYGGVTITVDENCADSITDTNHGNLGPFACDAIR